MKVSPRIKRLAWIAVGGGTLLVASLFLCDAWVARAARGRCFASVSDVPEAPVALVLGCSEHLPDGRKNLYFSRRIAAAAELFRAGRVRALIVSGDNHCEGYDEPSAMKAALVREGVSPENVACDYAGFCTLDSVMRAREVFGQARFIVVSQRFHCERAVFIARERGIEAFGFDATRVGGAAGLKTRLRESLARAVAVLDVTLLDTRPKFLGPAVQVELASAPVR